MSDGELVCSSDSDSDDELYNSCVSKIKKTYVLCARAWLILNVTLGVKHWPVIPVDDIPVDDIVAKVSLPHFLKKVYL